MKRTEEGVVSEDPMENRESTVLRRDDGTGAWPCHFLDGIPKGSRVRVTVEVMLAKDASAKLTWNGWEVWADFTCSCGNTTGGDLSVGEHLRCVRCGRIWAVSREVALTAVGGPP